MMEHLFRPHFHYFSGSQNHQFVAEQNFAVQDYGRSPNSVECVVFPVTLPGLEIQIMQTTTQVWNVNQSIVNSGRRERAAEQDLVLLTSNRTTFVDATPVPDLTGVRIFLVTSVSVSNFGTSR